MPNISNLRFSLPPRTELTGKKRKYTVINILSISERSVSVLCKDLQGKQYRLKLFNGKNSIDEQKISKMMSVNTKGVIRLVDTGTYESYPFWICTDCNVKDTMQQTISVQTLISTIVPQISYVMNAYHSNHIVLRDIAPEHILFDASKSMISFIGFSNMAILAGRALNTREPGYGQSYEYVAPEVTREGYSTASDYFSLGITLLNILKGKNIFENITQSELYNELKAGRVPGVNIEHLRKTPYEMYSAEDRLLYLVLGLLIPNPNDRWGYGEIRCWCNNQQLPLVQKGNRIQYQYNQFFEINHIRCWNNTMISECLARYSDIMTSDSLASLYRFLKSQLGDNGNIDMISKDKSVKSQIFKLIYILNPTINGFWWKGACYKNTDDFVKEIKNGKILLSELQEILYYDCFSYYVDCRNRIGMTVSEEVSKIRELEKLEKSNPGVGANRCLMLFADNNGGRSFRVGLKDYCEIMPLVMDYANHGLELKKMSKDIINNDSFQAWLWARGMEKVGQGAQRSVRDNDKNSFGILMMVFESCLNKDTDKKKVRELFLKYGDLSPIVWLINNIRYYKVISPVNQTLYDTFRNAKIDLNKGIVELNDWMNSLISDYQLFVQRTLNNPFALENESIDNGYFGYYPVYESGYFCCKWNDLLEVCPAFINAVEFGLENEDIKRWLRDNSIKQKEILEKQKNQIIVGDISESGDYIENCNKNIISSVVMLIIAAIMLLISLNYSVGFGFLSFVGAVIFPLMSLSLYYQRKVRAEIWYRGNYQQAGQKTIIQSMIHNITRRENEIFQGIINKRNNECKVYNGSLMIGGVDLDEPDVLDLSTGQKVMAYLSTYSYVMLATVIMGSIYASFLTAALYAVIYGVGAPYLLRRKRFINSCFEWSITTCIVAGASIFGSLALGNSFMAAMNWICIAIIVVFVIFSLF